MKWLLCLSFCILVSVPCFQAANISVASYLARRLVEIGSEKVFGVTGDYSYLFLHAVEANINLTRVGNNNELEAAYAAWGYSRSHPKQAPGVISTTYSVGSYNALTGVVGADIDNVPLIFVAGAPPTSAWQLLDNLGIVQHHIANDVTTEKEVFSKFTVAAEVVQNAQRAAYQIDSAILAAITFKRPVYIAVWTDVWTQLIPEPTARLNPATVAPFVVNTTAVAASVAKTVSYLQTASFPCIFAGRELRSYGLQDLFERFVNRTNLPYFTTPNAKGILSESNLQLVSNTPGSEIANSIDFLLEIGTHYGDFESRTIGLFAPNAVVQIKARKNSVTTSYRILYPAVPLANYLQALNDALLAINYRNTHYNATRQHMVFPAITPAEPFFTPLTYNNVVNQIRLRGLINKNNIITVDTSFVNSFLVPRLPVGRDGWVADAGILTIGWTGGSSLGIKEANPDKRVIVVVGDGAFQNVPQGLATAQREGHNTIVFLLHNNVYCIEQMIEDKTPYNNLTAPFFAENLIQDWNYAKLAEAYGGAGFRVNNIGELDWAITLGLLRNNGITLIEVMLPLRDYPH